eukprot:TRINITY_DN23803_c0_g1_i1.p1 TRINITY_DN23803_c0_g1~~TRINITY_DN23803_c0_g1_i1.p1  ORF type:complete len:802 (-),score=143.35 TRINITY_DN23803_c0_g1_i1:84-2489(-)
MVTKDEKWNKLWDLLPMAGVGGSNVDEWAAKMKTMMDDKQQESLEGTKSNASNSPSATKLRKLAAEEPVTFQHWGQQERQKLQRGVDNELNPSQCAAVAAAAGRRMTLIQGPPGTGKTTTSVRLLSFWARQKQRPLLATSDSNIAVDNIAEGLQALGVKVVRVGRPEKVTSNLEDATLESLLRQRLDGDKGKGSKGKDSSKGSKGKGKQDAKDFEESAKQRRVDEFEAKMAILRDADVICTTTIAAGSDFLHLLKLKAILIDEVAQATELSAIVPIVLRGADKLVLVGDHCQLPPSICSLEAETRGLSLSLFTRMATQGIEPYFLDTQFRMHPMIAAFSARQFYHGKLKTGVASHERPPPQGFDWPQSDSGIAFVHVDSFEKKDGETRANSGEVSTVSRLLVDVLKSKELTVLDIGIVTPYAGQVRALRQALRRELPYKLQGTGVDLTGGLEGKRAARALEIASVDAFQGREKELIIFSAVRSNRHGQVGFLADWRRLNVMITRARRGLIIVGNTDTLRADTNWASWLDWADESGLVLGGKRGGNGASYPSRPNRPNADFANWDSLTPPAQDRDSSFALQAASHDDERAEHCESDVQRLPRSTPKSAARPGMERSPPMPPLSSRQLAAVRPNETLNDQQLGSKARPQARPENPTVPGGMRPGNPLQGAHPPRSARPKNPSAPGGVRPGNPLQGAPPPRWPAQPRGPPVHAAKASPARAPGLQAATARNGAPCGPASAAMPFQAPAARSGVSYRPASAALPAFASSARPCLRPSVRPHVSGSYGRLTGLTASRAPGPYSAFR